MNCFVGIFTGEQCHKQEYQAVLEEVMLISELAVDEQTLLKLRVSEQIDSICHYHKYKYLSKFHHIFGKKCSDPLLLHKRPVKNGLRKILIEHLSKPTNVAVSLIPGKSLCPTCATKIFVQRATDEKTCDNNDTDFFPEAYEVVNETPLQEIDTVCESLDLSPLSKITKLNKAQRHSALRKKNDKIAHTIKRKLEESFTDNLEENATSSGEPSQNEYQVLINKLKEKCSVSEKDEKIKIISLLPDSWSKNKICEEFAVSEYLVRITRELVKTQGILPNLSNRQGHKISEYTVNRVIEFYEDDENSRLCPGKKDFVSVIINNIRVHKQKRLILIPLNELFSLFKQKYLGLKIGRSAFCALRPKWCVLPGSSGSHIVCVCKSHQNVKLMIEGAKLTTSYRDLLDFLVCDVDSQNCMFSKCSECPGPEALLEILMAETDNIPDQISFKQWVSTDRAELITQLQQSVEFLQSLVEKLMSLKTHHFISKIQSQHLKELKENITNGECVILGDFAENYTFTVQDEIQSFHWTNEQATLHPFVYYYKTEDKICCRSLCVISDHLTHDTATVHAFQKHVINDIKTVVPDVNKVIYFSDGASSQYKNKKNFINVCHHFLDFGLCAEWNFFASSHGKNACDGIGGTTKRLVARTSLQRPYKDQILTPQDMYHYCSENITGIKYVFVSTDEIQENETKLKQRFDCCQPIPGTRGYHRFLPISENEIRCFKTSKSTEYDDYKISTTITRTFSFHKNDNLACIYDNMWWIGRVAGISEESNDLLVHFFHPSGPRTAFQLSKNDTVWVPISRVLRKLTPIELSTATGRTYNITEKLCNEISELFNTLNC